MKLHCASFVAAVLTVFLLLEHVEARHVVSSQRSMPDHQYQHEESYYIDLTDRQDDASENEIPDDDDEPTSQDTRVEGLAGLSGIRNPLNDFFPHVGKYVYEDTVNKYVVKRLIDRTVDEFMPPGVLDFYKQIKKAETTLYKVISPFNEGVSDYSRRKLKAGVDWSLIRGYKLARNSVARMFA